MSYDSTTGLWTPDNPNGSTTGSGASGGGLLNPNGTPSGNTSSVIDNVNADLAGNSTYIQAAKAAGTDTANQRGVLNSSIAAGASQAAAYNAVTPIATADAANTTSKDLSAQNYAQSSQLQSQGATQASQLSAQNYQQSQELQDSQNTEQTNLANISQQTQLQIANMNVASDQQDKAQAAATTYASIYSNMVDSINNNTQIPADARQAYLDNALTLYNNGMGLIEQTYNVSLDWGSQSTDAGSSGGYSAPQAAPTNQSQLTTQNQQTAANYTVGPTPGLNPNTYQPGQVAYTDPGGNQYDAMGNYLDTI